MHGDREEGGREGGWSDTRAGKFIGIMITTVYREGRQKRRREKSRKRQKQEGE